MPVLPQSITDRREFIILSLMLGFLHASILLDFGSPISRAMLLIHLGLFLIWQPIQEKDKRLVWYNGIIFIILTLMLVYWINWWLVSGWLILLIGIVGGRVVINRNERNAYMLVMIFLVAELLIGCIPRLFVIESAIHLYNPLQYGISLIPLVLMVFPKVEGQPLVRMVDLLQAITASLLCSLLALGSLVIMYHVGTDYIIALIQTLMAIGICLFAISWLLSPHAGFSGLSELWSRSILNIGTPFEQWLIELSQLRQDKKTADEFLEEAMKKLVALPWMAGVKWTIANKDYSLGEPSKNEIQTKIQNNPVTLCTNIPIGGALFLHCNLLIQLIDQFYVAKIHEQDLSRQAHLQAIYETGARITHDIKNLLQAMHSMITILKADTTDEVNQSKSITILKKQFPYFIQRLELAMNKLQTPGELNQEKVNFRDWWQDLQSRYKESNINFNALIEDDPMIPADLFDSVSENLLENIFAKQKSENDIKIYIDTIVKENVICLLIRDTGSAIDENTEKVLFKEALNSDNGLGIGLYQAAKQAESLGYSLLLKNNVDGDVCFKLKN